MTEFKIPAVDWSDELSKALRAAEPGDVVLVRTEPMLRVAQSAAERMGKTGVTLKIADVLS